MNNNEKDKSTEQLSYKRTFETAKDDGRVQIDVSVTNIDIDTATRVIRTVELANESINRVLSGELVYRPYELAMLEAQEAAQTGESFKESNFNRLMTDGFEKTVVALKRWADMTAMAMAANKQFRIEIKYNAEEMKTDFCIYTPSGRVLHDTLQEDSTVIQDVTLKQAEFNTMLQEYSESPSNVKFGLDNAIIKLNNEDGTMRPVLDVISELKMFYETSFEMGTVIHLEKDDISETEAESTDVQKLQQKILWEVDVANDGVLQIHPPTNSNYISIHGADELWFLICRLMDCIQLE